MKLAKLSLAAIVVAGLASSSFAADTLADAFKNGKLKGEVRAWYFDRDRGTAASEANIIETGLRLTYVTDAYMGLSMGATFQSNFAPFADEDAKRVFNGDIYGSGSALSEAYVNYAIAKTNVKVGRQFIGTPLIAGSGSRMIQQAFEGAIISNTDLPQTTLVAGYISKYQNRTDGAGNVAEFNKVGAKGDGAYTLLAINKSIPGVTVKAQWVQITDSVDDYYLEAEYAGKAGSVSYALAANYLSSDYDAAGADSGTMYGVRASLGMGDFSGFVAYSVITDDNAVAAGLGSGAQPIFAKANQVTAGTYTRDTQAYSIDANYNFKQIGLKTGARYTNVSNDVTDTDAAYTDLYVDYAFTGALKGLNTYLSYEDMSRDIDGSELWFKATYKF